MIFTKVTFSSLKMTFPTFEKRYDIHLTEFDPFLIYIMYLKIVYVSLEFTFIFSYTVNYE